MAAHNGAREAAQMQARGWLPLAGKLGNVLVVPLTPAIAWRLGEAFEVEPFAPMAIAGVVEEALLSYLDEKLPK